MISNLGTMHNFDSPMSKLRITNRLEQILGNWVDGLLAGAKIAIRQGTKLGQLNRTFFSLYQTNYFNN